MVDKDLGDSDNLEELCHMTIKEFEGTTRVKYMQQDDSTTPYTQPLKLWKMNIESQDHLTMDFVGDYWDEQIMSGIEALLKEYEDLFLRSFTEIKGIKGNLGEVKIELKSDA
jgi:hypothetical protein